MDAPAIYLIIYLVGIIATVLGYEMLVKKHARAERDAERRAIIALVYGYKPLAAAPDIRDTKRGIIDAIIEREENDRA